LNRSSFALLVALLIHLLFLLLFWILGSLSPDIKKPLKKEEKRIKISLKEMPTQKKFSGTKQEKVVQTLIAPPMPKGSQLKKITKQPPIKFKPQKKPKKTKLNKKTEKKPSRKKVEKTQAIPPNKPYIPLKKIKPKKEEEKSLFDILSQDKSELEKEEKKSAQNTSQSSINQDIKELYGDEFGKLTPGQQKYILDNQEIMRRITQQVLTRVARVNLKNNLNVNKNNTIEFKLHPNGDMTDFRFLQKSGYYVLDDTTKETISYAYSRYPRPKEVILIRYNVYYNLARY